MKTISLITTGIKGGNSIQKDKIGRVVTILRHSEDRITIDDFEGYGENYKQRELSCIEVYKNGRLLFSGNKYELFDILEGK